MTLTEIEREQLKQLIAAGTALARKLAHARLLLKADQDRTDDAVAEAVEGSPSTVARVRRQDGEEGLEAARNRRPPRRAYQLPLAGAQAARLIALAWSRPPQG